MQIDPHREDDELGEVVDAHVKRQVGIFGTLTDSLCNRFKARDSVFQSKNEPEGNGKGRRRWSSFQVIYEMSLAVSDLVLERGNGARGKGAAF